ncbi:MAG TPA: tyrosine-type recombinase/integrase [Acidimicrobiales bacterium]|jgi:integrase|nr:tyrosine-type recombinase/integrase [Acidimicrobiales bacterium]
MARDAGPRKDPSNGTWWFVVDLPPAPDGRRRQAKRRGFTTKAAAQGALDELRVESRQGTYVAPFRQTVAEFLRHDWLPAVRRQLAESTWESYERNIRHHVEPRIGQLQLSALDGSILNRLYGELLESGRVRGSQSPGLKPRTVRYVHTIVHAALKDAVRWRRLPMNPADQATPPSAKASKPPEMKVWTGPQLADFLDRLGDDRYRWPWLFLATTGCRRGEALGLRWQDVDFERRLVAIRQELIPLTKPSGRGREGRLVPRTKTERPRVIELDGPTVAALRTWRVKHTKERLLVGDAYEDHDLVFCWPDGRPYHPEAFSKTFDRRLRQAAFADLPRIRLHDLRHTWATLALVAGVDVKVVSERLGHASPLITWQTYQHVIKGMQTDAAEKVAALIFGTTTA